jgi:histidine triad (HIT) family protein
MKKNGENNIMSEDCIFCKIASGEMESELVYEDEQVVAFSDINPVAPHHILIIPRKHIESINDMGDDDEGLIGHLFLAAGKLAKDLGVDQSGYRCVINTNKDAGQAIFHIHLHLLAGRKLGWPPG